MVVKVVIESPVSHSDYTQLIKKCLREFGQEKANHLGSLIVQFRDNHVESKNFKFRVFIEGKKYVSFLVKGGWGRFTRTKYLINESVVKRYDWRNNFWSITLRIVGYVFKAAGAIAASIPLALTYAPALNWAGNAMKKLGEAVKKKEEPCWFTKQLELKYETPPTYDYFIRSDSSAQTYDYNRETLSWPKSDKYNRESVFTNKTLRECRHFIGNYIKIKSKCCNKLYCCWMCHNQDYSHRWISGDLFICTMCPNPKLKEYRSSRFTCSSCGFRHKIKIRK